MDTSPELEIWKNASQGMVVVKKFSVAGQIVDEQINGGRSVHLTPKERHLNQEIAADHTLDVFKNGLLVPVQLIDSESDTKELQANSNAMSETAMKALFRSQSATFKEKVGEVSNASALKRLLEVAREVDAKVGQVEVIQARLAAVTPQVMEVEGSQNVGGAAIGTAAPKGMQGPEGNRTRAGVTPK